MPKRPAEEKTDNDVVRSFRIPKDIHDRAAAAALADDRTLNSYLIRALREKLDRDGEKKAR